MEILPAAAAASAGETAFGWSRDQFWAYFFLLLSVDVAASRWPVSGFTKLKQTDATEESSRPAHAAPGTSSF